jgi:hypothetical protein
MALPLQPHWNILFRQKFQSENKVWEFHKKFYLPVQPYVGLVIREKDILLLVSEATWDVDLKMFTVDQPNCPLTPEDVEETVKLYKSQGWKLEPGIVWE